MPLPSTPKSDTRNLRMRRITSGVAGLLAIAGMTAIAQPAVAAECAPLELSVKVMLQGAYDQSTGLMRDQLRTTGVLPATEPYSGLGFTLHGGEGSTTTLGDLAVSNASSVVDWIVVELRDPSAPATIIATDVVPLGRNGVPVETPSFSVRPGYYIVAVEHRNHLALATSAPIALGGTSVNVDFTDPALGVTGYTRPVNGTVALLAAGDANHSSTGLNNVRYNGPANDRDALLAALGGNEIGLEPGYFGPDLNMDGVMRNNGPGNDRDFLLATLGGDEIGLLSDSLPAGVLAAADDSRYACDVVPTEKPAPNEGEKESAPLAAPELAETGTDSGSTFGIVGVLMLAGVAAIVFARARRQH